MSRPNVFARQPMKNNDVYFYHERLPKRSSFYDTSVVTTVCVTATFVYLLLRHYRLLPVSFSQVAWHVFIFLLPCRVARKFGANLPDRQAIERGLESMSSRERHLAKASIMSQSMGLRNHALASWSLVSELPAAFSPRLFSGHRDSIPPGLCNWDNSCYQNSIIQGLASLPALREFLSRNIRELRDRGPLPTHLALEQIIVELNNPANAGRALWIPDQLRAMSTWQQQDAQEYFAKILEQIDREAKAALRGLITSPGYKASPREVANGELPAWPVTVDRVRELYPWSRRNPLEGLCAQRVGCTRCGWSEGLSSIPFNCVTVSLGQQSPTYSIQQCLDEYTDLEHIEGVECVKCTLLEKKEELETVAEALDGTGTDFADRFDESKVQDTLRAIDEAIEDGNYSDAIIRQCAIPPTDRVLSTKTRQAVIARPPQSLVIHVNRSVFDENSGLLLKNYAQLRFPMRLDLSERGLGARPLRGENGTEVWEMNPAESLLPVETLSMKEWAKYELQAIICHYGRHDTGHYISFRKYPFEDEDVPDEDAPDEEADEDDDDDDADADDADDDEDVNDDSRTQRRKYRWFKISDERVIPVSEEFVLAQGSVFMLFYEAVQEDEILDPVGQPVATEEEIPFIEPSEFALNNNEQPPQPPSTPSSHQSPSTAPTSVLPSPAVEPPVGPTNRERLPSPPPFTMEVGGMPMQHREQNDPPSPPPLTPAQAKLRRAWERLNRKKQHELSDSDDSLY